MDRYRKKPVVIEAFQITEETRWDNRDWPEWLNRAWNLDAQDPGAVFLNEGTHAFCVQTLEGPLHVSDGDWIVRGVKGELYPCKPDIFEATYEAVECEVPGCTAEPVYLGQCHEHAEEEVGPAHPDVGDLVQ